VKRLRRAGAGGGGAGAHFTSSARGGCSSARRRSERGGGVHRLGRGASGPVPVWVAGVVVVALLFRSSPPTGSPRRARASRGCRWWRRGCLRPARGRARRARSPGRGALHLLPVLKHELPPPPAPKESAVPEGIAAALERLRGGATGAHLRGPGHGVGAGGGVRGGGGARLRGLLAWARRLEWAGAGALLRTLVPVHAALAKVGADVPRRWAARGGSARASVGGEEIPFAEGWVAPLSPSAVKQCYPARAGAAAAGGRPAPSGSVRRWRRRRSPSDRRPGRRGAAPGDSMIAGSLGATLERTLAVSSGLRVTRAAAAGHGLARPDVYDWMRWCPRCPRERPASWWSRWGQRRHQPPRRRRAAGLRRAALAAGLRARVEAMMRALTGEDTGAVADAPPDEGSPALRARAFLNGVFAQCARKGPGWSSSSGSAGRRSRAAVRHLRAGARWTAAALPARRRSAPAPAGSRAVALWVRDWVRERRR